MNNSGEVQTSTDASLDLAGLAIKATLTAAQETFLDPVFEQLGLTPFDPELWDSWPD